MYLKHCIGLLIALVFVAVYVNGAHLSGRGFPSTTGRRGFTFPRSLGNFRTGIPGLTLPRNSRLPRYNIFRGPTSGRSVSPPFIPQRSLPRQRGLSIRPAGSLTGMSLLNRNPLGRFSSRVNPLSSTRRLRSPIQLSRSSRNPFRPFPYYRPGGVQPRQLRRRGPAVSRRGLISQLRQRFGRVIGRGTRDDPIIIPSRVSSRRGVALTPPRPQLRQGVGLPVQRVAAAHQTKQPSQGGAQEVLALFGFDQASSVPSGSVDLPVLSETIDKQVQVSRTPIKKSTSGSKTVSRTASRTETTKIGDMPVTMSNNLEITRTGTIISKTASSPEIAKIGKSFATASKAQIAKIDKSFASTNKAIASQAGITKAETLPAIIDGSTLEQLSTQQLEQIVNEGIPISSGPQTSEVHAVDTLHGSSLQTDIKAAVDITSELNHVSKATVTHQAIPELPTASLVAEAKGVADIGTDTSTKTKVDAVIADADQVNININSNASATTNNAADVPLDSSISTTQQVAHSVDTLKTSDVLAATHQEHVALDPQGISVIAHEKGVVDKTSGHSTAPIEAVPTGLISRDATSSNVAVPIKTVSAVDPVPVHIPVTEVSEITSTPVETSPVSEANVPVESTTTSEIILAVETPVASEAIVPVDTLVTSEATVPLETVVASETIVPEEVVVSEATVPVETAVVSEVLVPAADLSATQDTVILAETATVGETVVLTETAPVEETLALTETVPTSEIVIPIIENTISEKIAPVVEQLSNTAEIVVPAADVPVSKAASSTSEIVLPVSEQSAPESAILVVDSAVPVAESAVDSAVSVAEAATPAAESATLVVESPAGESAGLVAESTVPVEVATQEVIIPVVETAIETSAPIEAVVQSEIAVPTDTVLVSKEIVSALPESVLTVDASATIPAEAAETSPLESTISVDTVSVFEGVTPEVTNTPEVVAPATSVTIEANNINISNDPTNNLETNIVNAV